MKPHMPEITVPDGRGALNNSGLLVLRGPGSESQKEWMKLRSLGNAVLVNRGETLPDGRFEKIVYFFPKEDFGGELSLKFRALLKYGRAITGVNSLGEEKPIGLSRVLGEVTAKLFHSARKLALSAYWLLAFLLVLPARRARMRSRAAHGKARVLHLAWSGHLSGVTVVMKDALGALDRSRFEPYVCFIERGGDMADELKALGYDVTILGKRHCDIDTVAILKKLMEEKGVDILHAHGFKHSIYGRFAAFMAGVPVIISHFHGGVGGEWKKLVPFGWLSLRFTDALVSLTGLMKDDMAAGYYGYRADPEKVVIIPNSVDTEVFRPAADKRAARERLGLPDGITVMGIVARLSQGKGHGVLLDALALLKSEGYEFLCLIIGKGPLEAFLKERSMELGIAEDVIFMGARHDIADILPALDLHVQPSTWAGESFSLSTVEAMSCGVPVVASGIGGLLEVVDDGLTGLLFTPGNQAELAGAIKKLVDEPELREVLGGNARIKAGTLYSKPVFGANISKVYNSLLNKPR